MSKLRVLDIFSGVGGFSLGLKEAGDFETVAFCEIDPFCRRVLAKQWPEVPIYHDVQELTRRILRTDGVRAIDVIVGGFPCQDISAAGSGAGIDGKHSGLWTHYARLIKEIGPTFVIIENSPCLRCRGLGEILNNLWTFGYDAEWHVIPASAVGAWHKRERIWVIAYPQGYRRGSWGARGLVDCAPRLPDEACGNNGQSNGKAEWTAEPPLLGAHDDVPYRLDRVRVLGNALVPAIPKHIGRAILAATKLKLAA